MAIASAKLIDILQQTVALLENSEQYQWGHSGACNCGHLAQVITGYDKAQIHYWAMQKGGDWSDNSVDYCESSGYEIDRVIEIMLSAGLQLEDIQDIENLSNPRILAHLRQSEAGQKVSSLNHNQKEDVVLYFRTWIDLLEQDLALSMRSLESVEVSTAKWVANPSRPGSEVMIYDSIPNEALRV